MRCLSWPPGLRETDGIWAKHWYAEVERSTSFNRIVRKQESKCRKRLREIHDRCREFTSELYQHRLH